MPQRGRSESGPATIAAAARPAEVGGAQSIRRAMAVLRHVASHPGGTRLRDVAKACALNKATCHRILAALVEEGFLETGPDGLVYGLGREALAIGWAARARQDIPALARPGMMRLSEKTADTVFLSIRSGGAAICIAREVGSFPIKTLTLEIGSRRPLGVGSGSLTLLAFAPEDERETAIAAVGQRLAAYPTFTAARLAELVAEARRVGHAFNDQGVMEGMSAVGVPVLGEDGHAIAALSIAAITPRMRDGRRGEIVDLLHREAGILSRRMTGGAPA